MSEYSTPYTRKQFTLPVLENEDGELYIEFPEGTLPDDWQPGQTIKWIDQHNGTWLLKKVDENSKYVMVECISQYRMRYCIEIPSDGQCSAGERITYAEDSVSMEQCKEFSQKFLGDTIISSKEVSKEELLRMCDEENDYARCWSDDQKIDAFVTPIGYKSEF